MKRLIHEAVTDDEILQELWKVKDETTRKFKTVANYAKYLIEKKSMPKRSLQETRRIKPRRAPDL